ncbi:PDZ domain-containing protein [Colwelliaceae bacterium 6441]
MTTAFNLLGRKRIITIMAIFIVSSAPVKADECSTINIAPFKHNGKKYIGLLSEHNGEYQKNMYKPRKAINRGEKSYFFAPGLHTIKVAVTPTLSMHKLSKAQQALRQVVYSPLASNSLVDVLQAKVVVAQVEVKANRAYQLHFSAKGENDFSLSFKEQEQVCTSGDESLFTAKDMPISSDEVPSLKLPEVLDYRLHKLMTKIAEFHQENTSTFANLLPVSSNDIFGALVDNNFSNDGEALKVITVMPYSPASKLTLLSGDRITHLDGKKVSTMRGTPTDILKEYLTALYIGKRVKINLLRNEVPIELSQEFIPLTQPEVSYLLAPSSGERGHENNIRQHVSLPGELKFEYDQLVAQLYDYFQTQSPTTKAIHIKRLSKINHRFGVSGNVASTDNGTGLKILAVDEGGIAQQLGLLSNDIWIKLNGNNIIEENSDNLSSKLDTLIVGDKFSVTVNRAGQTLTFEQLYQPPTLTAFNLTIDLYSKMTMDANLLKKGERNRRSHNVYRRLTHHAYDPSPRNDLRDNYGNKIK